ncbi:MAG: Hsp33 family molecular chaperone HslO [Polyangiaceae bacterium]|nr:Hsp33 family molecular chaperone HslO [Polyangiaceae bacterium]
MSGSADCVLRTILDDGSFRVIAARTTDTVAGTLSAQGVAGRTARALGELLTSAILFRETMAPGYRVQGILRDKDGKSTLVADSHPSGDARGLVQLARGRTEVGLEQGALLQMMRSLPNGSLNQGVVQVPANGDLSAAMMAYMQTSEQVTSLVSVATVLDGQRVLGAGGLLVQLLPEANATSTRSMVERFEALGSVTARVARPGFTAQALVGELLAESGHSPLGEQELRYHCWCSEVRVMSALATLDRSEIEAMLHEGQPIEVNCDYCRTEYRIPTAKLRGLLSES